MSFYFYNPIKLIHGIDSLKRMPNEIPAKTVLAVVHGSTLLAHKEQMRFLETIPKCSRVDFYEYAQTEPSVSSIDKIVSELREDTSFIIGVGGGSVMDATKAIAVVYGNKIKARTLKDQNPMELTAALKFGLVATKPGSGSELNNAYVLMDNGSRFKRSYFGPYSFPQFSVQDPIFYESLKAYHYAAGLTDAMSHIIDQYLVDRPADTIQDALSLNFIAIGCELAKAARNPSPENFSKLAWFSSLVSSGLLSRGVKASWALHEVAHSLSSSLGLGHAESIALSLESVLTMERHPIDRLISLDRAINCSQVFTNNAEHDYVGRIVEFFKKLGMQTDISTLTKLQVKLWTGEVSALCQNLTAKELEQICSRQ